jgi:hypothetical protein
VLLQLAGFMDRNGANGRPSEATLAAILGAHPKSIRRSLSRLGGRGLIMPTYGHPHRGLVQAWSLTPPFIETLQHIRKGNPAVALSGEERATGERGKGNRTFQKGQPGGGPSDMTDIDRVGGDSRGSPPPHCPTCGGVLEYDVRAGTNLCPRCGETP